MLTTSNNKNKNDNVAQVSKGKWGVVFAKSRRQLKIVIRTVGLTESHVTVPLEDHTSWFHDCEEGFFSIQVRNMHIQE